MQMYNGMTNRQRAQVLVEALPYIQKYNGKIVVVKYGGNAMINEELKHDVMRDMVLMSLIGVKMVLVHGGGPEISSMLKRVGKETEFVNGLRVTDEETSEIVQMVLAGKINKSLVAKLDNLGGRAMGICGMDGGLIKAQMIDPKLGYVGKINSVNPQPILDLLEKGYIPVVSTIGCDETGHVYNINADTAAASHCRRHARRGAHLHDGHRRSAPRPERPDKPHPPRRFEGRGGAEGGGHHLRRHDSQGRVLHQRHPRGRAQGVHHRRPRSPRAAD